MVRQKRDISPDREEEMVDLIRQTKEKFKTDIRELELSKREFSTAFTEAMVNEFRKILPKSVLDMKATDFVKQLNDDDDDQQMNENEMDEHQEGHSQATATTPAGTFTRPCLYKSLKTPSGLHLKVPSYITPRVDGKLQQPRASKYGEILFSVRGTPVMNTVTAANLMEAKRQEVVVQNLLQQEEKMLTPETRKIITKLKCLVQKRTEQNGAEADDEGGEGTSK